MSKLDIDTIRRSGDATSIADRSKALMELNDRFGNHELTLDAGVEAAVSIFGNNTPQFKARCELLLAMDAPQSVKAAEASAIDNAFSASKSRSIAI